MGVVGTISSKGQVTVPVEVRRRLGVGAGDQVEFVFDGKQTVLKPVRVGESPFTKWMGIAGDGFKNEGELLAWERELRGRDAWDEKDLEG